MALGVEANIDWLFLRHAPKLGSAAVAQLLEQFGDAAGIRRASRQQLATAGLAGETVEFLLQTTLPAVIESDLRWVEQAHHRILTPLDADYPLLLRSIAQPPCVLYVKGNYALLNDPQLAIVGSRNPSASGADNARRFAEHFGRAGLVITSGLATGVDGAAHEGALAAEAPTVAVMATGIDRIYPASHKQLAALIEHKGALVTEMPPGTPPLPALFPQRNRIISGLALGVLVVEAARRSGSLITARLAMEQAREVFAIPGSIHNPLARGCHQLIRQGAKLVESAQDVLEELAPRLRSLLQPPEETAATTNDGATTIDPEYSQLLDAMGYDPVSIDQLVLRSGLPARQVASMLLILELQGNVRMEPGGLYSRAGSE